MADEHDGTRGRTRVRPGAEKWKEAMATLMAEHEAHGCLPHHVVDRVAASLAVTITTLERRYDEHLRGLERRVGVVRLSEGDKAAASSAICLADAHSRLARAGSAPLFPLFERAVWRDGGDRALAALREAECDRRAATRSSSCTRCAPAEAAA